MSGGGKRFLNHSNIEAVLNKRQPGDSPRTTTNSVRYSMQPDEDLNRSKPAVAIGLSRVIHILFILCTNILLNLSWP